MWLYDELDSTEQIKISQRIKVKITQWGSEIVPESVAVYEDRHVGGNRSVRIFRLPKNHRFQVFDEIFGDIEHFSVAPKSARDGRKKVYIFLRDPRRVYSFHTSHWSDELTVSIKCGNNILNTKKFPYPQAEVTDISDTPKIEIGTEIRMIIFESGAPRPKLIGHEWNESKDRSIMIYQLSNKDHHFQKGEVIKATIDSISVGPGLAMGKRKKVIIALRDPKRVYSHRINTAGDNLTIECWCGSHLLKTRAVTLRQEDYRIMVAGKEYNIRKLSLAGGKVIREYAPERFGDSIDDVAMRYGDELKKIAPNFRKRLRANQAKLPRLEKVPNYNYLVERVSKRHRLI